MNPMNHSASAWSLPAKIIALLVVLACLAMGAVGLVLPIVPGLLFLALAAIVLVKAFPSVDARLRRYDTVRGYMERLDGVPRLGLPDTLRLTGLLAVKILLDTFVFLGSCIRAARTPRTDGTRSSIG